MHEIAVGSNLLADNDAAAAHNREHFREHGVYVINLMSAPGAGKTTVLEKTVAALAGELRMAVIEGDVQGDEDAERLRQHGVEAIQINTGGACHLDARQISEHIHRLDLDAVDLLVIENVGNLVCPAEFDLGEHDKVMLLSVTEGDDKPRKYPVMFHQARVMLVNKVDLIEHTDFDMERASRDARGFNGDLEVFPVSARTGEGLEAWYTWLRIRIAALATP